MTGIELSGLRKTYRNGTRGPGRTRPRCAAGMPLRIARSHGAGKSSTINILAGLLPRDAGEIRVCGETVHDGDVDYMRRMGFVLERPHFIEKLTADEYLKFAAAMYGLDPATAEKRADELIETLDLTEKRDIWIEKYSAGMKKKVSLAAACIHKPDILILDEPFESVDPIAPRTMQANLRHMSSAGVTVLLSSHNLAMVERFCDEVAIIHRGRNLLQLHTDNLQENLKHSFNGNTEGLLEELFVRTVDEVGREEEPRKLSWF